MNTKLALASFGIGRQKIIMYRGVMMGTIAMAGVALLFTSTFVVSHQTLAISWGARHGVGGGIHMPAPHGVKGCHSVIKGNKVCLACPWGIVNCFKR